MAADEPRLLTHQELSNHLVDLFTDPPGSTTTGRVADHVMGRAIVVEVRAPSFPEAVRLIGRVAERAERMNHHPDVDLRWRTVRFVLSTHSAGGVTLRDVELVREVLDAAREVGAEVLTRTADARSPVPERLPLEEFDQESTALVVPRPPRGGPLPRALVLCFFPEVIDRLVATGRGTQIARLHGESGRAPVLQVTTPHGPVAVVHPGVGAALASLHLEELLAGGARTVIACGGAGAVRSGIPLGQVVIPTAAVRDEGTSYHYVPAARTISLDPRVIHHLETVLDSHEIPAVLGTTWTTDAPYRETPARIRRRRAEGCLTVEMETSALAAVCAVRGAAFGHLLYAADDVSGAEWDHRNWTRAQIREHLLDLAVEAAATLPAPPGKPGQPG